MHHRHDLDIVRAITDGLGSAYMAGKPLPDIHHTNYRIVVRRRQGVPAGFLLFDATI